ncbi:MAG: cytochrome b/b6 domain-containing protein [Coriobacteriales bacterium]|nr:cytochrome b/b6 domain-containing protein [Coriobacteriales bacterium]
MAHNMTVEEHPWPAIVMHWLHVVSFLTLIVTGILIYQPPLGINMEMVRTLHFFMMFVFMLTFIVRVYWAFFGRGSANAGSTMMVADWRHFAPERENRGQFFEFVKYYLFLRRTHPKIPKYNPLQKMTYGVLFPLGIILMAVTGFAIWTNTMAYLTWFTDLVGGLGVVRLMHYFGMWILIMFWMIHVYLTVFEEPGQLLTMFFHYLPGGASTSKTETAKS